MHVSIPRKKLGRWNFSFGPWIPSSGSAKPSSTVGIPNSSCNVLTTGIVPPDRTKTGATLKPRRYAAAPARIAGSARSRTVEEGLIAERGPRGS
jgi:hypothetical protein